MDRVLVGGVFDIFHYGHLFFLREAKKLGDYLIVAIESDANTKRLKGSSRPVHSEKQRKEILESLRFVDEVIVLKNEMRDEDYLKLVQNIRPKFIAVTEGDPVLDKKRQHAKSVGAKIIEIPFVKDFSSTGILKQFEK